MLFPEASDGQYQYTLNRRAHGMELFDVKLNYEQSRAEHSVMNENYGLVPYSISGPPGTGKTKTLVELALQLVHANSHSHILMCAPSDPAADTLVRRLSIHLGPSQLCRLNSPARSFPEVPDTILPWSTIDGGMFTLPPFRRLMQLRIVVTTCRDAELLIAARLINRDLVHVEQALHDTLHPDDDPIQPRLHWTALLMDEAAQATEPETIIPLSVVTPPSDYRSTSGRSPAFVLAGDQFQLGPRTASKTSAMQTSLFERLSDRPFYRDHPLARSAQSGGVMRPLTQDMLPILRPAFTNLIRNYRSHPAILATPSSLFYDDTLEPEAADTDALAHLPIWQGKRWPVLFATNTARDEIEQDGGGWYCHRESRLACQYAKSLLESGLLRQEDICIMSPFRAQVRVLRKLARAEPFTLSGVNIGPLEAFQGLEFRFVIVCTTRTRDRFLEQDLAKGLGVIHEPRRFNVALTRAKQGMIVIGNPHVLEQDRNWLAFMAFCHRNGLWSDLAKTSWRPEDDSVVPSSRLERQLLYQDEMALREEAHFEGLAKGIRHLRAGEDDDARLWRLGKAVADDVFAEDDEGEGD